MSHFSTIESAIRDREVLLGALASLGLTAESHEEPQAFTDWYGSTDQKAEVIVRGSTINTKADIGFARNADEAFTIWADKYDWDRSTLPGKHDFLDTLQQEYSTEMTRRIARARGMRVEETTLEDGTRRLVLTGVSRR
jgi:hypothetical protein